MIYENAMKLNVFFVFYLLLYYTNRSMYAMLKVYIQY